MWRSSLLVSLLFALTPVQGSAAELPQELETKLREQVLQWINENRVEAKLPTLSFDRGVNKVAELHADDTAEHFDPTSVETREQTYLAHTSSDGKDLLARFKAANVDAGWGFAENTGYWTRNPFGEIEEFSLYGLTLMHEGMMAEVPPNDAHRENILGPYTHLGVGLSLFDTEEAPLNAIFLVTDFSRRVTEEEERAFREAYGHIPTSPRTLLHSAAPIDHEGPFIDIRPEDNFVGAITALKEQGILAGYADGTFGAEKPVSRAELVKMLLVTIDLSPIGREFNQCFTDVFNQWFAPYVCLAKRNGWITGYEDGSFRATNDVSRAEGITLTARIFAFDPGMKSKKQNESFSDVPRDTWFSEPISTLASHDILPFQKNLLHPEQPLTRGEMAEMLSRAHTIHTTLKTKLKEAEGSPRNLHEMKSVQEE